METFLFLLELAGTVAFAVSGAVLGIEKHMDIFGVGLLGITTAVGGGILRDLVVGLTPPRAFQDPMYLLVALGVGGRYMSLAIRWVYTLFCRIVGF